MSVREADQRQTVSRISEITYDDFKNPTRDIFLPPLPGNVLAAMRSSAKPVLLKKNILEKNRNNHKELTPEDSRIILSAALYHPDLVGQTQKRSKPYYWVAVKLGNDENSIVVLDVFSAKENMEIVGWRYARKVSLEQLKRQAEREGDQFLILSPAESGLAAGLSALPSDMSFLGKDTTFSSKSQEVQ